MFANLGLDDEVEQFLDKVFDPVNEVLENISNINEVLTGFNLITDLLPEFNDPRIVRLDVEDIPVKYLDEILERDGFNKFKDYNEERNTNNEGVPKDGVGKLQNSNEVDGFCYTKCFRSAIQPKQKPSILKRSTTSNQRRSLLASRHS